MSGENIRITSNAYANESRCDGLTAVSTVISRGSATRFKCDGIGDPQGWSEVGNVGGIGNKEVNVTWVGDEVHDNFRSLFGELE